MFGRGQEVNEFEKEVIQSDEEVQEIMKQRRWYNILNLFSRSSQDVQEKIISKISYETLEELTEVCEILDDFDQSLVNTIDE